MGKRELTEQEKQFAGKNIQILLSEINYLDAMVKRNTVNIETAPAIYARQIEELENELKKNKELLIEAKKTVEILNDQIQNRRIG